MYPGVSFFTINFSAPGIVPWRGFFFWRLLVVRHQDIFRLDIINRLEFAVGNRIT